MAKPRDDAYVQVIERIQNVLSSINTYRAQHLEDVRIDSIMTQLEKVVEILEERGSFSYADMKEFDFNLIEGTPFEDNENLARELYSIRNFIEHLPVSL